MSLHQAFQSQPMVLHRCLRTAIVTIYPSLGILKFWWHRLCFDRSFQVSELPLHVYNTSAADRTFVRSLHVFTIASMMDTVTAPHEYYGLRRREHVLAAYRTVAVSRPLDATMGVPN